MTFQKNELQVVIVKLHNTEYGLEIGMVKEIIKMTTITKLPNTEEYIMGIINLRGSIIPIIDMKKKFFEVSYDYTKEAEARIIVIEAEHKIFGLLVDEVTEVLTVPSDSIEKIDKSGIYTHTDLFSGIVKIEERLLILLNVNKILNYTKQKMEV